MRLAFKHAGLGILNWRTMWRLWQAPVGTPLAAVVRWRPEIWGMLQAPFISAWWTAEERFARIIDHCEVVGSLGRPFDLLPNEFVDLIEIPEIDAEARIKLDSPRWLLRDGLLVISLWLGGDRIYSVAFLLSKEDGRLIAYVGGIQGRRSAKSLELNRVLTKAANAMRPPDFLVEIFRSLCEEIGVEQIRGVSDQNRHQRSAYFQQRAGFADPVRFDYDSFWRERGGLPGAGGFFVLPVPAAQRSEADIPARKRALYRRRREMMDAIRERLRARLNAPETIILQEHEPRWI